MTGSITVKSDDFPGNGEVLIYPTFSETFKKDKNLILLNNKTNNLLFSKFKSHDFKAEEEQLISLELNSFYKHIIIVGLGKKAEFTSLKLRKGLAEAFLTVQGLKHESVTLFYDSLFGKEYFVIGKEISLALNLVNYSYDTFKSEEMKKKLTKIHDLFLNIEPGDTYAVSQGATEQFKQGINYGNILAEGISLTRNLVNLPGSHLNPETLEQEAFTIAKKSHGKITVEVLDEGECRELGMGAFLGVAQGSEMKPKFIILKFQNPNSKLQINSKSKIRSKKICLIGKSITFDSGGLSLKPSNSMETMKCDMAGGATVLGVFKILQQLEATGNAPAFAKATAGKEIYGILPACENMPSGSAMRPGDIVTAMNKKTIEVLNTDAEGRLTLADALVYAETKLKPDIIIDLATLTGACMVALGTDIAGLFGNDGKLQEKFTSISLKEGDDLWSMPLYKPYVKMMKSDIADLKNVTGKGYGGAITASLFLAEFVNKAKWLHIDIAGPAYNETGQKGIISKGGTGWGILTIINLIYNI